MTTIPYYLYWDYFLIYETNLILFLQNRLKPFEKYLSLITEWLGPHGVENYLIPLTGAMYTQDNMFDLFVGSTTVNLITDIMKLMFQSSRPFWWINETTIYRIINKSNKLKQNYSLKLLQNEYTCETSSGFPSGHSSLLTVILLLNRKTIKNVLTNSINSNTNISFILIEIIIGILIIAMWVTRLYFSCHFLHQCIGGTLLSTIFLYYYEIFKDQLKNLNKFKATVIVIISGLLFGTIYIAMKSFDMDPQHSIRMAFKWCADPSYLLPETTVMVSICANLGTLLGVSTTLPLKMRAQQKLNWIVTVPLTILLIFTKNLMNQYTPKYKGRFIFLAWKLITNFVFSSVMINIITKFVKKPTKYDTKNVKDYDGATLKNKIKYKIN